MVNYEHIFGIRNTTDFASTALKVFRHQYQNNPVYQEFCEHLRCNPDTVHDVDQIPFLPIQFFKSRQVITGNRPIDLTFTSSGTTGLTTSKHHIADLAIYRQSFQKGFELAYGPVTNYCILALLPSYLEREGSSLIYMVADLIRGSAHPNSGFYLDDKAKLATTLNTLEESGENTLLIGVSFALLDLIEHWSFTLRHTLVMETGGMKGRRKELVREELHAQLRKGFGLSQIHSEYGMTELLSQAYSKGDGRFFTPPWMRVSARQTEDPLSPQHFGKTGGLNIIDLANLHSCPFIATQDLGKVYENGSFEVLGRFDHSDIRGCNLMVL